MKTNDAAIRLALIEKINASFNGQNYKIHHEMQVENKIIDVAVANGHLHGYEIKSDVDNLSRIKDQIDVYKDNFEYVSVVSAAVHLPKLKIILPECVGVMIAEYHLGAVKLSCIKKPRCQKLGKEAMIGLMTMKELADCLKSRRGRAVNGGRFACEQEAMLESARTLRLWMLESLKKRGNVKLQIQEKF